MDAVAKCSILKASFVSSQVGETVWGGWWEDLEDFWKELYTVGSWNCPPTQDASHQVVIIPFLVGNPNLNLHL